MVNQLRPADIASANYTVALKPLLGKEKKLYVSQEPAIEVAALKVDAAASLETTASTAGAAALLDRPSRILIKAEEEFRAGTVLEIGVVGTDETDAVLSGTTLFSPPEYAQEQSYSFPAGTAREVMIATSKRYKTITAYLPTAVPAGALNAKFSVFAMPDLDEYVLVGCRTALNYAPEVREALPIACGGDDSAYVKPGQKPRREVDVTVKLPSLSDGLARYNGLSGLVLLLESEKEDKLVTDREYLMGAVVTGRFTNPEASEPSTLDGRGIYEDYAHLPAGPLTDEA